MAFYKSDFHEARLRTDEAANKAFIKYNGEGKEREIPTDSTPVVDIIGARAEISEEEYQAPASTNSSIASI